MKTKQELLSSISAYSDPIVAELCNKHKIDATDLFNNIVMSISNILIRKREFNRIRSIEFDAAKVMFFLKDELMKLKLHSANYKDIIEYNCNFNLNDMTFNDVAFKNLQKSLLLMKKFLERASDDTYTSDDYQSFIKELDDIVTQKELQYNILLREKIRQYKPDLLVMSVDCASNYKEIAPYFAIEASKNLKVLVVDMDPCINEEKTSCVSSVDGKEQFLQDVFQAVANRTSNANRFEMLFIRQKFPRYKFKSFDLDFKSNAVFKSFNNQAIIDRYQELFVEQKKVNNNFQLVILNSESDVEFKELSDMVRNLSDQNKGAIFTLGKDLAFINAYWLDNPCVVYNNTLSPAAFAHGQMFFASGFNKLSLMKEAEKQIIALGNVVSLDMDKLSLNNVFNKNKENTHEVSSTVSAASSALASSASAASASSPGIKYGAKESMLFEYHADQQSIYTDNEIIAEAEGILCGTLSVEFVDFNSITASGLSIPMILAGTDEGISKLAENAGALFDLIEIETLRTVMNYGPNKGKSIESLLIMTEKGQSLLTKKTQTRLQLKT